MDETRTCEYCLPDPNGIHADGCPNRITQLEAEVQRLEVERDALRQRVQELEAERRWIPVSERLPENDLAVRYQVLKSGYCHEIAWYSKRSPGQWVDHSVNITAYVTHWQRLPEPPEGVR